MKSTLDQKIAKYKKEKAQKGNLEAFLAEKRKNIEKMFEEQAPIEKENDFRIENYANEIDQKHQKYLEDMDELQNVRFRIIEVRGNFETLQLEMNMQEDNMASLRQAYSKEVASQEEILGQLRARMAGELAEKIKMEEERCQKQLEYAEKLTNEKEELINRSEELLIKRKNMDLSLKKLKDSFEEDYKKQREVWAKAEQQRRDKWEARKLQEISENTLKGLQPQINRIVKESKREIGKIEEKYELLRNEYQQEMNREFQNNLKQIRKGILDRAEEEKMYMLEKSNEQYRKLMDKLISTHENEKMQLKCAKEAELRDLDARRKRESSEFMSKNKDYLLNHLNEVKQIKSNYQKEIRDLDGSLDQLLWKEEEAIKSKYQRKVESHREEKRKELEGKVKAYHFQQKQTSENQYEDIVEKVAVENQVIENNLRKQTEAKIREYKESNEAQMKTIRKNLQAMVNKQRQQSESLTNVKEVKESIQVEYEQLMRENEYLKKKELEYQAEIVQLKTKESEFVDGENKDKQRIEKQWGEQLEMLQKKIGQIEEEMLTQQRIIEEKQEEERSKIRGVWSKLEKESLQFMKKLKDEIDRARKEKAMKAALNAKLQEMRKKLREMESKRRQTKL